MKRVGFGTVIAIVLLCGSALGGTAPVKHSLQFMIENSDTPASPITLTGNKWTALDSPTVIKCASDTGCLITVSAEVGLGAPDADYDRFVICTYIDGVAMSSGCPSSGWLAAGTNNGFDYGQTTAKIDSARVTSGTHHVQTKVFLRDSDAILKWYQCDYSVWRP